MTTDRPLSAPAAFAAMSLVAAAAVALPATPAHAHGATSAPVSRAVACAPDAGRTARSAACRAAVAASDGRSFDEWDNVRVADVRGRDRQVIPDGRLCSGGIDAYRGLDLPRADWPATTVSPGARFAFRYRQRIPHRGTFRLYVTDAGYDPTRALRWSDVGARPFLSVIDPPLRGEAYEFSGRLPRGRTGRHLILAIWQNSDTPDTYYSCSDVVFRAAAGRTPTATARPARSASPAADAAVTPAAGAGAFGSAPAETGGRVGLALAGSGVAALALVAGVAIWRRRRSW
jgi:chitin-binding protein